MVSIKRVIAVIIAFSCMSAIGISAWAEESTVTEFDWSKIAGIFEAEDTGSKDNDNVNVIGETGVVQGGLSQNSNSSITVKTTSTVDLTLLANQTYEVTLYDGVTAVAVQRIAIGGGEIAVVGLGDGVYDYKINGAEDVLTFETSEGSCTVSNGVGTIKMEAEPVSVLYVVNSAGAAEYEFAQVMGTFSTETLTSGFAVQQGLRYKVRKVGDSDYTSIEVPAMSIEYTFDLGTKQSNTTENEQAYKEAELPDEIQSVDNPYNIPPTTDKNDIGKTDVYSLIVYYSISLILIAVAITGIITKYLVKKRDNSD